MKWARYYHTLKHLKYVQVADRVRRHLPRSKPAPGPTPPLRRMAGRWIEPYRRPPSMVGPERFRFLNQERELIFPFQWTDSCFEPLWLYNLHYFDDLNAVGSESRSDWHEALIERWVADNAPAEGIGWDPYPLSLRIVNWIKWALHGRLLPEAALRSLAMQARWLERRMEWHLLGNHLIANAKALVFAGLFFAGEEADRWLRRGRAVFDGELQAQILPDGGHVERSPMYHGLVAEDVLDLINLFRCYRQAASYEALMRPLLNWLDVMTHPDGQISFFNDAAFEIAPKLADLSAYAARLGLERPDSVRRPLVRLDASGYFRLENERAVVIADIAPIGPDYQPGHAHADTLSFELSLFGERVLVNSGTSQYGSDDERQRQRSTAAHNAVVIDGEDSSEVWSGFRVARRAYPKVHAAFEDGSAVVIEGSHDGYTRLPGQPTHRRRWKLGRDRLEITDTVVGKFTKAQARFHFHPDVVVACPGSATKVRLHLGSTGRTATFSTTGADGLRTEASTWHPEFGRSVPNVCLVADLGTGPLVTRIEWA